MTELATQVRMETGAWVESVRNGASVLTGALAGPEGLVRRTEYGHEASDEGFGLCGLSQSMGHARAQQSWAGTQRQRFVSGLNPDLQLGLGGRRHV